MVSLASDFTAAVPSQVQAQLTWNGTPQGWVTFGTSGHNSGDVYALPLQVSSAVSSSAHYPWGVEVKATVGTFVYDRTASGVLPVLVNASSPYGAGWSLGGTQALLIGSAGVALIDNSTGGFRYFTGTGPSYTSPANDQGTLVQNMGGSFTYTAKDQTQTNFNSSGNMTSQVDPHGLTQTLSYSVVIGIQFRSTLGIQSKSTNSTTLACGADAAAGGRGCALWTILPGFDKPTETG